MSTPRTVEQQVLARAATALHLGSSGGAGARLDVLEAAAARLAGWHLTDYRRMFEADRVLSAESSERVADEVLRAMTEWPADPALALAALGHSELTHSEQRTSGAYYTDFRLATHLAGGVTPRTGQLLRTGQGRAVDPASGSGILLVALVLAVAGDDAGARRDLVADALSAADLSADAIRATRLALAALTDDLGAVEKLDHRLLVGDSLLRPASEWSEIAPDGFALVIGNPPWEKLKITRHEVLQAAGMRRHYGSVYDDQQHAELDRELGQRRRAMLTYLDELDGQAHLQGSGEADLYKLFLDLGCRLLKPDGELAALLPAGVIRSQGTEDLRRLLICRSGTLSIDVLDNRARFFCIDTRFKFLAVHATFGGRPDFFTLQHCRGTATGVRTGPSVAVDRERLRALRPDLTVPEVRSPAEWELFERLHTAGLRFGDPHGPWKPTLTREVDMTRDRPHFAGRPEPDALPLIEGRMVHQFRAAAKAYSSGSGRAAVWEPVELGEGRTQPQFYYPRRRLRRGVAPAVATARAGFCDITGQTNERSLLAAVIPPDVVCGNKVPTVTFTGADPDHLAHVWVAIVNSLAFDWLARRVITTSVNYFLLLALPLPDFDVHGPPGRRLAGLTRSLQALEHSGRRDVRDVAADLRAEVDVTVAQAWRLSAADLRLMLQDFPLLDRGQPPLPGERISTVTRDLLLHRAAALPGPPAPGDWADRADRAQRAGAVAYVPADHSSCSRQRPSVS